MGKSTKQKEITRKKLVYNIDRLAKTLSPDFGAWNINKSLFGSSEETPLDNVTFHKQTRRYRVSGKKNEEGTDDAIAQAMVMILLYRIEKGWGNQRAFQALSIWGGTPSKSQDDPEFPLENLWEKDVKDWIATKKLGKSTLNHQDNFYAVSDLFNSKDSRWKRRSTAYLNQVHILTEQASVQMALEILKRPNGHHYATLAAFIIHYALDEEAQALVEADLVDSEDDIMMMISTSLLETARKERNDFAQQALEDIMAKLSENERKSASRQGKRQKVN